MQVYISIGGAALIIFYLIATEALDWVGRGEIIEKRWPKVWAALKSRTGRLLLLFVAIGLLAKVTLERNEQPAHAKPEAQKATITPQSLPTQKSGTSVDSTATTHSESSHRKLRPHDSTGTAQEHRDDRTPATPNVTVESGGVASINQQGGQTAGTINNYGTSVPLRYIESPAANSAGAILDSAPAGSKIRFRIVGGTEETIAFSNQVMGLFASAKWKIVAVDHIGQLSIVQSDGTAMRTSRGEGLHCSATNSLAAYKAMEALEIAGFPCKSDIEAFGQPGADFYISIGSRIRPE